MAHRTNVIQVPIEFAKSEGDLPIVDPYCGRKMPQREARHVMFRSGEPLFFCSRECLDKFRTAPSHVAVKARKHA